jgi:hypothetical protein
MVRSLTVATALMLLFVPVASAGGFNPTRAGTPIAATPGTVVSFDGLSVTVPAPGHEVTETATTTTGGVTLQVQTASDGSAYEATSSAAVTGATSASSPGACTDVFEPGDLGFRVNATLVWFFHSNSTPSRNNVDNVETDLKAATSHITNEYNDCGRVDSVSATQSYGGRLQRSTDVQNDGGCNTTPDGYNMVGFGILPTGVIATNCYYSRNGSLDESDLRLNSSVNWITDSGTGCQTSYVVDAVATHERGHTFGMDDVFDTAHSELTMYHQIAPCTSGKETLALGDMLRLESKY